MTNIDETAGDGRGRGHRRGDQMRPAAFSLPAFKIPVTG